MNIASRITFTILTILLIFCIGVGKVNAFRFVSWGDAQDGGTTTSITSNQIVGLNPAFTIFNGDLNNDGFTAAASDIMTAALNGNNNNGLYAKTFLVRGNHDIITSYPITDWSNYFQTGNKAGTLTGVSNYAELSGNLSYSFDYGNSRFIALDLPNGASGVSASLLSWLDQRLNQAELINLTHAFIYFHHPIYCVESIHCSCSAVNDPTCISAGTNSLLTLLNAHPIVSAAFHGDEHVLARTKITAARINGVTHEFEQFVTSPSGAGVYNSYLYPNRVDDVDLSSTQQGFASVDVEGSSYTVNFYRVGSTYPVWARTFDKNGNVTIPPVNWEILVPKKSIWKYLDNGSDQGTSWTNPGFQDSAWSQGPAKLGYSSTNTGYGTTISYGPNAASKYITTYFRKSFTVNSPATVVRLNLGLLRDDGARVYLNGTKVYENNMPTGAITYLTKASSTVNDENLFHQASINPALLVGGNNVIAVEMHQSTAGSSDLSMDLELIADLAGTTPTPTPISGQCQSAIVPAYFYPPGYWNQLTINHTTRDVAVMNPNSGPGTSVNQEYVTAVNQARNNGLEVSGYVATGYGAKDINLVKNEINNYAAWYGVNSIFLDEAASTQSLLSYYQELYTYIKTRNGSVTINPGTVPYEGYMNVADHVVIFENNYTAYASTTFPSWITNYNANKFVHLVYNTPESLLTAAINKAKSANAGFVYITNDDLPNPWDTLPSYWNSEVNLKCATTKPDANGDGLVNEADYNIWLSHYGQTVLGISMGDFNNDNKVDGIDYVIWLNNLP